MAVQIKRYANRKLYNTETSRYITLGGISDLVREGREIQVLDNETGNDISSLVLSRVLVDTERKVTPAGDLDPDETVLSSPVLGELVQRQLASLFALLRRYADDVQGNLSDARDNVVRWIQASSGEGSSRSHEAAARGPAALEQAVDSAVRRAVRDLDLPTRADLAQLQSQLEELTEALQKLHVRR